MRCNRRQLNGIKDWEMLHYQMMIIMRQEERKRALHQHYYHHNMTTLSVIEVSVHGHYCACVCVIHFISFPFLWLLQWLDMIITKFLYCTEHFYCIKISYTSTFNERIISPYKIIKDGSITCELYTLVCIIMNSFLHWSG